MASVPDRPPSGSAPLRVAIVQPVLPAYRRPIFQMLSEVPEIELTIYAAKSISGAPPSILSTEMVGYAVRPAPRRRFGPFQWQPAIWTVVGRSGAGAHDVVVLTWNPRYLQLWPALIRAKLTRTPVILWGHAQGIHDNALRRRFREVPLRVVDVGLIYGRRAAVRLLQRGFKPRQVVVAPNALDQKEIQASRRYWLDRPDEFAAFRVEHGLTSGDVILYVSRLTRGRNLNVLLRALELVRAKRPSAQLVIIGDGPDRDRIHPHAAALGLGAAVRFIGDQYEEKQLAPWFLSASIMAYPSPIGLSLLHAFGYGLPVVTGGSADGHRPEFEYARDGYNSLLYRDADREAMAQRIAEALDSPGLRERLSEGALATVSRDGVDAAHICWRALSPPFGALRRVGAPPDQRVQLPERGGCVTAPSDSWYAA